MRTQSCDTAPEIERIQIAGLRALSPARKFASVRSDSATMAYATMYAGDTCSTAATATMPTLPDAFERAVGFVARQHGLDLATRFAAVVQQNAVTWVPSPFDVQAATMHIAAALSRTGMRYAIAGRLACALYGFPRSLFAVELLTDMRTDQAASFVMSLRSDYCAREYATGTVAGQGSLWSLLHLSSLVRIDLCLPRARSRTNRILRRAHQMSLVKDVGPLWVAAPEDVALMCIAAFLHGGEHDDELWNDVLGLLKVQASTLDLPYLRQSAPLLGVAADLEHALADAGLQPP